MWLTLIASALAAPGPGAHALHAANPPTVELSPLYRDLPVATPGPDLTVYGYKAHWAGELATLQWDELSHVALFAANATTDGSLTNTSRWGDVQGAVAIADTYGVKVHLCVVNFDTDELRVLLGSATARQALIDRLATEVANTGAHGVNIDFEGVPGSRKQELVDFTKALALRVPEVVLATPAVDWNNAWDYSELTKHADLFIMGYGYHWAGSQNAGPVDPLYGHGPWSKYALDWTVDNYKSSGADPSRVILGLPLYGYRWPTSSDSVPGTNTGTGSSEVYSKAWTRAATHGARFESSSRTPWYYDGADQVWFGDPASVGERIAYADSESLAGIGFWALGYGAADRELWDIVREETHIPLDPEPPEDDTDEPADSDDPPDPTDDHDDPAPNRDYVAQANRPFLAYPNEIVELSGSSSEGPADAELQYLWIQVAGPSTVLTDESSATPRFQPLVAGVYAFELAVGDGTSWSAADRTHVIVIEPDAGERYGNCSCSQSGGAGLGWLAALGLLSLTRRRRG